eukprot:gene11332-11420_t
MASQKAGSSQTVSPFSSKTKDLPAKEAIKKAEWQLAIAELELCASHDLKDIETLLDLAFTHYQLSKKDQDTWKLRNAMDKLIPYILKNATSPDDKAKALILYAATQNEGRSYFHELRALIDIKEFRKKYPDYAELYAFTYQSFRVNQNSSPPNVCFNFSHPIDPAITNLKDYFELTPKVDGEVRLASDQEICITGIEFGKNYDVIIKEGIKSKYGEKTSKTEKISFIVENQSPRLAFSDRSILMKDDAQHAPLTAINIGKVSLQVVRISDRSFVENLVRRYGAVDSGLYDYSLSRIKKETGEEIYNGIMEIGGPANQSVTKQIPFKEIIKETKPGIYGIYAKEEGSLDYPVSAYQWLLITDLGITTFKGESGLDVHIHSLKSAKPLKNTEVQLIAYNNEILATTKTSETVYTDPKKDPIGMITFAVEDFVPSRLLVSLKSEKIQVVPAEVFVINANAKFLFGSAAGGLNGYQFGLVDEKFEGDRISLGALTLDSNGNTKLDAIIKESPKTNVPLEVVVQTKPFVIGLKGHTSETVIPYDATSTEVEIIAVNNEGKLVDVKNLEYQLFAEKVHYNWYQETPYSKWKYKPIVEDHFILKGTLDAKSSENPITGVMSSYRFEKGYSSHSQDSQSPDQLKVTLDKSSYEIGEKGVIETKNISISKDGTDVSLKADESWGTGAYILVTAFRPLEGLSAEARTLKVNMTLPKEIKPRQKIEIPLHIEGTSQTETFVTALAVDEGILQLTDYKTPLPHEYFLGKRLLGALARNLAALSKRAFKIVSLYSGPIAVDKDGKTTLTFDVPDFSGTLRIMIVAFNKTKIGSGSESLLTPLGRAFLANALVRIGDIERGSKAFKEIFAIEEAKSFIAYGSSIRDYSAILLLANEAAQLAPTLAEANGIVQMAVKNLGVRLKLPDKSPMASLPIALGGVGITLFDLTALYCALANGASWYIARILENSPVPEGFLDWHTTGKQAVAFKTAEIVVTQSESGQEGLMVAQAPIN